MKALTWIVICALNAGCVLASPPASKFTMKVLDAETGFPVTNAEVRVTFTEQADPWGTGVGKSDRQKIKVNEEGVATFNGHSVYPGCGGSVFADGYYSDGGGFSFTGRNAVLNRWEPWNPTIEVKMRKIKKPVPMAYYWHTGDWIRMPMKDKSISFDLEACDWVAPYGKGKVADFVFHPYRIDTTDEIRFGYTLTFSNPMDGIQEYLPSEESRCAYIFPYEAPTNGYVASLEKGTVDPVRGGVETNMKKQDEINYIFRVRSHKDDAGNVVGSYGRIKGELVMSGKFGLQFEYWFNPVSSERSLEYNGNNLLKK
jgi:hypothetical protein